MNAGLLDPRAAAGAALTLALVLTFGGAARADQSGAGRYEISPWLGWTGGARARGAEQQSLFSLNAGVEVTIADTQPSFFPAFSFNELRLGPWLAFDSVDRGLGEGGLSMILTHTRHASFGTFGLRAGAGYGADRATHFVVTATGGVRYVPDRVGASSGGTFSKVTGIRIVATCRQTVDPFQSTALVLGVEFEPSFFLPPYSIEKWLGVH